MRQNKNLGVKVKSNWMGKIVEDMEVRMYKRIMILLKKSKEKGESMVAD